MNNKKLGNEFEQEVCEFLASQGYWVHFIAPNPCGAQPFDVIAVKKNMPIAIDCKTCVANTFNISRLEDNQIFAFEKWMKAGNADPLIAVKHDDKLYWVSYPLLKLKKTIKLSDLECDEKFEKFMEEK